MKFIFDDSSKSQKKIYATQNAVIVNLFWSSFGNNNNLKHLQYISKFIIFTAPDCYPMSRQNVASCVVHTITCWGDGKHETILSSNLRYF